MRVYKKSLALKGEIPDTSRNFANMEHKNAINILMKAIKYYHFLFYSFAWTSHFLCLFPPAAIDDISKIYLDPVPQYPTFTHTLSPDSTINKCIHNSIKFSTLYKPIMMNISPCLFTTHHSLWVWTPLVFTKLSLLCHKACYTAFWYRKWTENQITAIHNKQNSNSSRQYEDIHSDPRTPSAYLIKWRWHALNSITYSDTKNHRRLQECL